MCTCVYGQCFDNAEGKRMVFLVRNRLFHHTYERSVELNYANVGCFVEGHRDPVWFPISREMYDRLYPGSIVPAVCTKSSTPSSWSKWKMITKEEEE